MPLLIVNADDFGCSRGVNRGIIEAHEHGIVTSASLMVNRPAASEAAEYGREHPELGVLHNNMLARRTAGHTVPLDRVIDGFRRRDLRAVMDGLRAAFDSIVAWDERP